MTKSMLMIFVLSFAFTIVKAQQHAFDKKMIDEAAAIITAQLRDTEGDDEFLTFDVRTVFKGRIESFVRIKKESVTACKTGVEYLIVAKQKKPFNEPELDASSHIIATENARAELTFLDANIPCVDPSLPHGGACDRAHSRKVCGCNGQTYQDWCMAHMRGVVIYSYGECK